MSSNQNIRVVITGVGLTAPNANNLKEFRDALLLETVISMKLSIKKRKCAGGAPARVQSQFIARMKHCSTAGCLWIPWLKTEPEYIWELPSMAMWKRKTKSMNFMRTNLMPVYGHIIIIQEPWPIHLPVK